MANPVMRLGFREPAIDTNRPLVDGTVGVEGFDVEVSDFRGAEHIDAWDASFGGLMQTKAAGNHPYVSIPAFPNRKFRLSYIFVNTAAGIVSPRDLEGKRVFVSSTAGIWARGALLNYYGVDFTKVQWVMFGSEAKSWAPGVNVESVPRGDETMEAYLDRRLLSGELDAVIEPNVLPSITRRDPRVARLFRDFKTEEQNYYRATGIFPISHMVSLKQEFVDEHPDAPVALLKAYRRARDVAFEKHPRLRPAGAHHLVGQRDGGRATRAHGRELLGLQRREQPPLAGCDDAVLAPDGRRPRALRGRELPQPTSSSARRGVIGGQPLPGPRRLERGVDARVEDVTVEKDVPKLRARLAEIGMNGRRREGRPRQRGVQRARPLNAARRTAPRSTQRGWSYQPFRGRRPLAGTPAQPAPPRSRRDSSPRSCRAASADARRRPRGKRFPWPGSTRGTQTPTCRRPRCLRHPRARAAPRRRPRPAPAYRRRRTRRPRSYPGRCRATRRWPASTGCTPSRPLSGPATSPPARAGTRRRRTCNRWRRSTRRGPRRRPCFLP